MALERRSGPLTDRQREVLALVARGRSNREVASELGITEDGVKAHLSRLFLRFGVTNRVELLAVSGALVSQDGTDSATLRDLRSAAGRANTSAGLLRSTGASASTKTELTTVRDALAAVDLALDLVRDLPPDTTGPLVAALRKRLAAAFDALDAAEHGGAKSDA